MSVPNSAERTGRAVFPHRAAVPAAPVASPFRARLSRKAYDMPAPRRRPTLREVLDEMEAVEIALSSMIRRREDHISEELRVEIMMQAYEPVLHILIRTERRGHKRLGWRKVEPAD
jgi:hypothetical protein